MKNSISPVSSASAADRLTEIPVIGKIIELVLNVWEWLIYGAKESFWGSRLFWAISILLALICLVLFVVFKKRSAEYRRRQVAAIDYLRDESLSDALRKKTTENEDETATPVDGYMLLRPKYRRVRFVMLTLRSELSSREMILPVENGITIGRSNNCSVRLKDRHVAAHHCTITAEGRKLFLSSDQSAQPTFVRHGRKVIQLENGDKKRLRSKACFQAGSTRFDLIVFRCKIPGGYI